MSVQSLNYGAGYGYYDRYTYNPRNRQQAANNVQYVQQPQAAPPAKKKTGFWEGVGAFCKGLVKPIVNMVKHPIKTALFIAGAAALIIGTGGAATPFLIGAGLAMGGYQLAKGTYNAITADSREETLAALEDMGEGTFTVGASLVGAKSYASGTSAGSATAAAAKESTKMGKFLAYTKGLGKDCWTTLKDTPAGLKNSYAAVRSGEAMGNLKSVYGSYRLARAQRRAFEAQNGQQRYTDLGLDKNGTTRSFSNNATELVRNYRQGARNFRSSTQQHQDAVFNKYAEMIGRASDDSTRAMLEARALHLADKGFVRVTDPSQINPFSRAYLPEKGLVVSLSSQMSSDPSIESYVPTEEEVQVQNPY